MTPEGRVLAKRRAQRLARYDELRAERPELFANPADAAYEIVVDQQVQEAVADESAAWLRASERPEEYGDIGVVYEDRFVIVLRDAVRFRNGKVGPYVRVINAHSGTGAAVMPVLGDGRILLVRHFRHALRTWEWEIPRGFAEPGADGATTAAREMREEVGVDVAHVELLGRTASDGGYDEIYLARLDQSDLPDDLTEDAVWEGIDARRLVTAGELATMIAEGEITDMYLLAAFAFAAARQLL